MDFFIHSSLTYIVMMVMLLVAVLVERSRPCFSFSSILGKRSFSSFHNIEWWEVFSSKSMNFFTHSPFSNIFLVMLMMLLMMMFLMVLMFLLMMMSLLSKSVSCIR